MHAKPQQEHHWLQKLIGNWTFEVEGDMGPDQPPQKWKGTDSVRTLGGLWVLCEGEGEMPGGGIGQTVMTLGFDPAKNRYVGTFIGSMMTFMWLYEGQLDGNVLTLNAEGPSFTEEGKMARYQDIIEFLSDDHRTLSSQVQNENGEWQRFMTAHYHRVK